MTYAVFEDEHYYICRDGREHIIKIPGLCSRKLCFLWNKNASAFAAHTAQRQEGAKAPHGAISLLGGAEQRSAA